MLLYDWAQRGLCAQVDPDLWFPGKGGTLTAQQRICGLCEVQAECLAYALRHGIEDGVWGGMSPMQRRRLGQPAA